MLDIGRPDMNFVEMARGMGVEGERAEDCEDLIRAFRPRQFPTRPLSDRGGSLT